MSDLDLTPIYDPEMEEGEFIMKEDISRREMQDDIKTPNEFDYDTTPIWKPDKKGSKRSFSAVEDEFNKNKVVYTNWIVPKKEFHIESPYVVGMQTGHIIYLPKLYLVVKDTQGFFHYIILSKIRDSYFTHCITQYAILKLFHFHFWEWDCNDYYTLPVLEDENVIFSYYLTSEQNLGSHFYSEKKRVNVTENNVDLYNRKNEIVFY